MTHILAETVDTDIIPEPGKETGVWNALDILYFEEQHPITNITSEMILNKRRELEGKAGDRSGLRQMKERWCRRHKINPYSDPNLNIRPSTKVHVDPLQKITAGLYAQIEQTVRAEIEKEVNALKDEVLTLQNHNKEQTDKLAQISSLLTSSKNEIQLLNERLKIAHDEKIQVEARATFANQALVENKMETCARIDTLVTALKETHQQQLADYHQELKALREELTNARLQYQTDISSERQRAEDTRHKHIVEIENLRVKISRLEQALLDAKTARDQSLAEIDFVRNDALAKLEEVGTALKAQQKLHEITDDSIAASYHHLSNQLSGLDKKFTGVLDKDTIVDLFNNAIKKLCAEFNLPLRQATQVWGSSTNYY